MGAVGSSSRRFLNLQLNWEPMFGLLRCAVAAGRAVPKAKPNLTGLVEARATSIPFVPTDWVFRYMPWLCRDRVRFMYNFNILSFFMGFGYMMIWCHAPFESESYDHFAESPLYNWVRNDLAKTGQLE